MMVSEVLEFLDQFQTMIVGIFGFIGVMWTLRANARHAHIEHQRLIDTKRKALRRILVAEFRNYEHALKLNLDLDVVHSPEEELVSIGRVERLLSEPLTADLGLLELHEIDIVANALISFEGLNYYLENISSQASGTRFLIPTTAWSEIQKASSTTAEALSIAIQALEISDNA